MLGLYLQELSFARQNSHQTNQMHRLFSGLTDVVIPASSNSMRMRSRPSRGTCVSCFPKIIYSTRLSYPKETYRCQNPRLVLLCSSILHCEPFQVYHPSFPYLVLRYVYQSQRSIRWIKLENRMQPVLL